MLMLLGAIASAMSCSTVRGMNITVMLSIWRLVLGVGMCASTVLKCVIRFHGFRFYHSPLHRTCVVMQPIV